MFHMIRYAPFLCFLFFSLFCLHGSAPSCSAMLRYAPIMLCAAPICSGVIRYAPCCSFVFRFVNFAPCCFVVLRFPNFAHC